MRTSIRPKSFSALVVDDNGLERTLIKRRIESVFHEHRYTIDIACDGQEGWNLCQKNEYTFYVIDYQMPEMNGVQLCNKVLARSPSAHIILYSASSMDGMEPINGAVCFINKDLLVLTDHLKALLGVR